MRVKTKTYRHLTFSESELEMLKTVEIERQAECDKHNLCGGCPFMNTFFCSHDRSIAEMTENSRKITLDIEEDDEQ